MASERSRMKRQEIEGLIVNAEEGTTFTGLRNTEAVMFRNVAFENGIGALIEAQDREKGIYKATIQTPELLKRLVALESILQGVRNAR